MPSDREALIAGIAADPDNDLRRLVVADWLEEHGEPERAEFIRLQIEAAAGAPVSPDQTRRIDDLFRAYGREWLGPFLTALDPTRSPSDYEVNSSGAEAYLAPPPGQAAFVRSASVRRGFVRGLHVRPTLLPGRCSLADAFAREPVTHLAAVLTPTPREWVRFSDPVLRHLSGLTLIGTASGEPMVAAHEAFADAHLPAVRRLLLMTLGGGAGGEFDPIPHATVQAFANSPLAYRLTELELPLDDAGLRALSRSHALRAEGLAVGGSLAAEGIRPLLVAGFAPTLRSLGFGRLDSAAVAALAKGERFARLTSLSLRLREPSEAAFRVLASARFLPQLERLHLSGDERMGEADPDSPGVRALADALNPDRLQQLTLSDCGFAAPPPCLLARFGDRVTV